MMGEKSRILAKMLAAGRGGMRGDVQVDPQRGGPGIGRLVSEMARNKELPIKNMRGAGPGMAKPMPQESPVVQKPMLGPPTPSPLSAPAEYHGVFKEGGVVKGRGDGIASRGKTKGRFC